MNENFGRVFASQLGATPVQRKWIWDGYIAPGQIALLTSLWKSGKTTLLAHLVAARKDGSDVAGRRVAPGVSVVISEEAQPDWDDRHARLGFAPVDSFFFRPFKGVRSLERWLAFLDYLAGLKAAEGVDLVIIDTLMEFLPVKDENNAKLMLDALLPFRQLTDAGIALLLVHHPRKATAPAGMTARGSGALPAFVDTLMEMYPLRPDDSSDRRRRLQAFSRDPATPRSLFMELNEKGTAFTRLEDWPDDDFAVNWQVLQMVLEDASRELTRQEILAQWPGDYPPPKGSTLYHWLDQAVKREWLARSGAGRKSEPYRYFLREKMDVWKDDPLYKLAQHMKANAKFPWDGKYEPDWESK